MRIIVFFDLPVDTASQRKQYRQFRNFLIKDGYLMMQESVYSKMAIDGQAAEATIARLRRHRPTHGLVQALRVTEKQYAGIEEISGCALRKGVIDSTERLVVL